MGIPVEYSQHEDAPSQHEIDLRYTDALTMADTVMTVRLVAKEIAQQEGVYASFMPKPLAGVQGSGMHTHFSLFEGDKNAFNDPGDEHGLSSLGSQFIAGLLDTLPRSRQSRTSGSTRTSGWSSATRLPSTCRGPTTTVQRSSGSRSRSGALGVDSHRVPVARPGLQPVPHVRRWCSLPGSGVSRRSYELPPETSSNLFSLTPEELASEGIRPLPSSPPTPCL